MDDLIDRLRLGTKEQERELLMEAFNVASETFRATQAERDFMADHQMPFQNDEHKQRVRDGLCDDDWRFRKSLTQQRLDSFNRKLDADAGTSAAEILVPQDCEWSVRSNVLSSARVFQMKNQILTNGVGFTPALALAAAALMAIKKIEFT